MPLSGAKRIISKYLGTVRPPWAKLILLKHLVVQSASSLVAMVMVKSSSSSSSHIIRKLGILWSLSSPSVGNGYVCPWLWLDTATACQGQEPCSTPSYGFMLPQQFSSGTGGLMCSSQYGHT
eukprot:scaffold150783_cov24-Tisochrysis_lutea.AAC.1